MGIVTAALWVALSSSALPESVDLRTGELREVKIAGMARVAVGDPGIADVKTMGSDSLLVIGGGVGTTTLLVWTRDGQRLSSVIKVTEPKSVDEFPHDGEWEWEKGDANSWKLGTFQKVDSSNPAVVRAEKRSGRMWLTAVGTGKATITATGPRDVRRRMIITVGEVPRAEAAAMTLGAIELNPNSQVMLSVDGVTSAEIDHPVAEVSVPAPGKLVIRAQNGTMKGATYIRAVIGGADVSIPLTIQ